MERLRKISALIFAVLFGIAALSFGIFAADACPDHPRASTYAVSCQNGNFYYHKIYCGICDMLISAEDCSFITYDCTEIPHCYRCTQYNMNAIPYASHDFPESWTLIERYHYKVCTRDGCYGELIGDHTYIETTIAGTVYLVCTICGYNMEK